MYLMWKNNPTSIKNVYMSNGINEILASTALLNVFRQRFPNLYISFKSVLLSATQFHVFPARTVVNKSISYKKAFDKMGYFRVARSQKMRYTVRGCVTFCSICV